MKEPIQEAVDLIQCEQHVGAPNSGPLGTGTHLCPEPPVLFMFWANEAPSAICLSHAAWALKIAETIGFNLPMEQFTVGKALEYAEVKAKGQPIYANPTVRIDP